MPRRSLITPSSTALIFSRILVWSGEIELENLTLKTSALEDLNLPITVTAGYIGKIHVIIPWTALDSKPLKVVIEKVYLQASPINITSFSSDKLREEIRLSKKKRLDDLESNIIKSFTMLASDGENPEENSKSFFESLTEKIVDNLEVSVRKIHIRYRLNVPLRFKTRNAHFNAK